MAKKRRPLRYYAPISEFVDLCDRCRRYPVAALVGDEGLCHTCGQQALRPSARPQPGPPRATVPTAG